LISKAVWWSYLVDPYVRAVRAGVVTRPMDSLPQDVWDELFETLATRGPRLTVRDERIVEVD